MRDYPINIGLETLDKYKILIPYAYGCGALGEVIPTPILATPILATPMEVCTETFILIGPFDEAYYAENAL